MNIHKIFVIGVLLGLIVVVCWLAGFSSGLNENMDQGHDRLRQNFIEVIKKIKKQDCKEYCDTKK